MRLFAAPNSAVSLLCLLAERAARSIGEERLNLSHDRERDGFGRTSTDVEADRAMQPIREQLRFFSDVGHQACAPWGGAEQADVSNVTVRKDAQIGFIGREVMAHHDGSIEVLLSQAVR